MPEYIYTDVVLQVIFVLLRCSLLAEAPFPFELTGGTKRDLFHGSK